MTSPSDRLDHERRAHQYESAKPFDGGPCLHCGQPFEADAHMHWIAAKLDADMPKLKAHLAVMDETRRLKPGTMNWEITI